MGKAARKRREKQKQAEDQKHRPQKAIPESLPPEALDRRDVLTATIVGVVSLLVYVKTLCPTIYTSGAGENVTAVAVLGVPHPPGYPLFCLLGKLFTIIIPMDGIAYRVNLFSATCGAAAAVMLYLVIRSFPGSTKRLAAASVSLFFAFSSTFWSQAVIAEVYTLNALLIFCIFLALLRWDQGGPIWPAALFAGLGIAVHPLQLLFFPGWAIWIATSERRKSLTASALTTSVLFFLAGASLHLYPYLRSRSNPILDWGNPENMTNLWNYLTASQYRDRMFSLSPAEVLSNLGKGLRILFGQFSPFLIPIPLIGGFLMLRNDRRLFFTTLVPGILTLLYAINYNIPWEIEVYYIPVVIVLSIWGWWAVKAIYPRLQSAQPIIVILLLIPLVYNYRTNDRSAHRIVYSFGNDILRACPENATLLVPQTDATFAMLYMQGVEQKRKDVQTWVRSEKGWKPLYEGVNPDRRVVKYEELLPSALQRGPVLEVEKVTNETLPNYRQLPFGVLHLIVPADEATSLKPPPFESNQLEQYVSPEPTFYLDDRSRAILASYYISRGDAASEQGDAQTAKAQYAAAEKMGGTEGEISSQLGMRFADLGDTETAIARLRESVAAVEDAGVYNRLGRLLAESGKHDEAMTMFLRAIELSPDLAIAHSNLGAILGIKGDLKRALEELETAVRLDPKTPLARNNLAKAYWLAGRREDAVREWQKSLELDPDQEAVRQQLESISQQP